MVIVLEHLEAYYEVHDVEIGTLYRWCPESIMVECECGEEPSLTASNNTCRACGADYRAVSEEVLDAHPEDKVDHPWRSLRPYYTPIKDT